MILRAGAPQLPIPNLKFTRSYADITYVFLWVGKRPRYNSTSRGQDSEMKMLTGQLVLLREKSLSPCGSVLLEFGIVIAGVMFGVLLLTDIGRALNEYLKLTHVVAEGAKTGTRVAGLQAGTKYDLDQDMTDLTGTGETIVDVCSGVAGGASGQPCGHLLIQQRVRFLLQNMSFIIDLNNTHITTELAASGSGVSTAMITVTVSSQYDGMLLRHIPLGTSYQGPYLM
jgi:hypothetical protein